MIFYKKIKEELTKVVVENFELAAVIILFALFVGISGSCDDYDDIYKYHKELYRLEKSILNKDLPQFTGYVDCYEFPILDGDGINLYISSEEYKFEPRNKKAQYKGDIKIIDHKIYLINIEGLDEDFKIRVDNIPNATLKFKDGISVRYDMERCDIGE